MNRNKMISPDSRRKILVVDDEVKICNALRFCLRTEGYRLRFAHSANEALELLKSEPSDLIISDHLIPGMTGMNLLKLVRDRHPDCIRILLTGHADMEIVIQAVNQGEIYRFLTKPWDNEELKMTLRFALEKRDVECENRRILAELRQQPIDDSLRNAPVSRIPPTASGAILIEDALAAV